MGARMASMQCHANGMHSSSAVQSSRDEAAEATCKGESSGACLDEEALGEEGGREAGKAGRRRVRLELGKLEHKHLRRTAQSARWRGSMAMITQRQSPHH